jgi:hypothetical protein
MKSYNKIYILVLFFASMLFCYSYLLLVVHGQLAYWRYNLVTEAHDYFDDFKISVRVRGMTQIFYPFAILPVIIIVWLSIKFQELPKIGTWVAVILGYLLIGILFYKIILFTQAVFRGSLFLGILALSFSIFLFWSKRAFHRMIK